MKYYAEFDTAGNPTGFYPEDVWPTPPPAGAVLISEEDYHAYKTGQYIRVNGTRQVKPVTLADAQAAARRCIRVESSARLKALVATYSPEERESWHIQEREARGYPGGDTPMLSAMAAARQIPLAEMAAKVMENKAALAPVSGSILGTQQRLLDQIAAIDEEHPDPLTAIAAITWPK